MHGYFVDFRLYTKARAIANPFAYAEHRDKLIRDKLAAEQESRIRGAKKAAGSAVPGVKVNKHLAKKIKEQEERARKREAGEADEDAEMDDGEKRKRKKKSAKDQVDVPSLLQDSRFGDLFANPDFEIDETSREFMLLNPSTKPRQQQEDEDEDESEEDGEGVAEGEFESEDDDDESGDSDSSQEGGAFFPLLSSLSSSLLISSLLASRRTRLRLPTSTDRAPKTGRQGPLHPHLHLRFLLLRPRPPSTNTRRCRRLRRRRPHYYTLSSRLSRRTVRRCTRLPDALPARSGSCWIGRG